MDRATKTKSLFFQRSEQTFLPEQPSRGVAPPSPLLEGEKMKIKDFSIFTEKARLVINSSSIRLENAQIQGNIQSLRYDAGQPSEKEKSSSITIKIWAKITDKDSMRELKGLINQTDF